MRKKLEFDLMSSFNRAKINSFDEFTEIRYQKFRSVNKGTKQATVTRLL